MNDVRFPNVSFCKAARWLTVAAELFTEMPLPGEEPLKKCVINTRVQVIFRATMGGGDD